MCHEQDETASDGLAPGPLFTDASAAFPSELHDYTIDFLHNDRASLCACSLVCKSWTASSQYHLFKSATIRVGAGKVSQFCELFASTHLNMYVGRLFLTCHYDGNVGVDERREWNTEFEAQLYRLQPLSCLEYLRLSCPGCPVGPSFPSAIGQNFSSIVDLELAFICFTSITEIFQSCVSLPHLRRLSLFSVRWLEEEDLDASIPDLPMLDTFAISETVQDLEVILRWLPSQPCISRIAIGIFYTEVIPLLDIVLRTLGPRLEHFIIDYFCNEWVPDLLHATALRTLEVAAYLSAETLWAEDSFIDLSALLEKVPGRAGALQRIILLLYNVKYWDICFDWPRVDTILASLDSLERVEFYVRTNLEEQASTEIIHAYLPSRRYALRVQNWADRPEDFLSKFDC